MENNRAFATPRTDLIVKEEGSELLPRTDSQGGVFPETVLNYNREHKKPYTVDYFKLNEKNHFT